MRSPWLLLTLFACSTAEVPRPTVKADFEIHGHRGARARRPENSLVAFEYALGAGVTHLELDLGVSRDKILVINHDTYINPERCRSSRVLQKKPLLKDLSLDEIKTYDCGSRQVPEFPNLVPTPETRIPAFRELLVYLQSSQSPKAHQVKITVETKYKAGEVNVTPAEFVDLILRDLRETRFPLERVILQSFDFSTIKNAKEKVPELKTAAVIGGRDKLTREYTLALLKDTQADYLLPNGRVLTPATIEATHSLGKKIVVWTINFQEDWRKLAAAGVDGIITDDPEPLRKDLFP